MKRLWIILGILVVATPVGLLAEGAAWGEWTARELEDSVGFVPKGMAWLEGLWKAPLPGYEVGGLHSAQGYVISAIVGVALVVLLTWFLGRIVSKGEEDGS